jgi:photosystem II stability/assembly factor-like uncharacterized protein
VSGHTGFFYSIFFISESTGWAVGQGGTIRKTTNAGVNWISQTSGFTANYLCSVFFTDVNTGYIVGSGGLILKTTNGGGNWSQQPSGVTNTISCVYFPPSATSMTGFASGGSASSGIILKTSNAGLSWSSQSVGTNWLFGIYFVSIGSGWAVGFNGTIYATTDMGSTWFPQSSGITDRLVAVSFPNSDTGYAVGYAGKIVKTTNGGANWLLQTSPTTNNLWGVYFTNVNTGWAAGWNGTILHTTNGGVTYVQKISSEVPSSYKLYQNYPNPFNPGTRIRFEVPHNKGGERGLYVTLRVYDMLGKEIEVLINELLAPGTYEIRWAAANTPSGVYFCRLSATGRAGDYSETRKIVLLK